VLNHSNADWLLKEKFNLSFCEVWTLDGSLWQRGSEKMPIDRISCDR
jgi:hypothetical protein